MAKYQREKASTIQLLEYTIPPLFVVTFDVKMNRDVTHRPKKGPKDFKSAVANSQFSIQRSKPTQWFPFLAATFPESKQAAKQIQVRRVKGKQGLAPFSEREYKTCLYNYNLH